MRPSKRVYEPIWKQQTGFERDLIGNLYMLTWTGNFEKLDADTGLQIRG